MNEDIKKYYEMKLLWDCKRIRDKDGTIKEVYFPKEKESQDPWIRDHEWYNREIIGE